jgi:hypothetical protein
MTDYAALAQQFGGESSSPQQSAPIDYAALAAAHGAIQSPEVSAQPAAKPSLLERFKAGIGDPVRALGLTARAGLEGAGDVAGIIGNPISAMTGGALRRPADIAVGLASDLGLPTADTPTEQFVNAATRGGIGAGGMVGVGSQLARLPANIGRFGKVLAAQPVAQVVSGAGGGAGAELAHQGGASAGGQLAAGLAGAVSPTAIAKGAPMLGRGTANIIGGLGTHTGGLPIQEAAKAGYAGGDSADLFAKNMRGNVPISDILDAAKANLQEMGQAKSAAYRAGMADVSKDAGVLNFDGIDKAVKNAGDVVTFKGQTKNAKAADIQQKIADEVANWKSLPPDEFHTPEGLDALKQKIGGIVESIPYEEKTARMVGGNIYNAIKDSITKQAPTYADTMRGYSDATDQIREIERSLSQGGNASTDTQLRKLQSIMRNNVNTNYGSRVDSVRALEQQGGNEMIPALAGQALNTWTPRGLGGAVAGGLGMGGYAMGGPALAVPVLAAQSPRLVGEAALKVGQGAGIVNRLAGDTAYPDMNNALIRAAQYGAMGANQ